VALDLVARRLGATALHDLTEGRPAQLIAKRPWPR
jgi:hypothetical protein